MKQRRTNSCIVCSQQFEKVITLLLLCLILPCHATSSVTPTTGPFRSQAAAAIGASKFAVRGLLEANSLQARASHEFSESIPTPPHHKLLSPPPQQTLDPNSSSSTTGSSHKTNVGVRLHPASSKSVVVPNKGNTILVFHHEDTKASTSTTTATTVHETTKEQKSNMESASRIRNSKLAMELLGTSILVMTIQLAVGGGDKNGVAPPPLTIGAVLIAIIYGGAPISGAHYNPAVSLAFWLQGKLASSEMMQYWLAQLVGAYVGALLGGFIGGTFSGVAVGGSYSLIQALLAEVVFTFILGLVILNVAIHPVAEGNQYYGLAIGLVVIGGATAVGGISGAAFNPAVAMGLCLASKTLKNLPYVLSVMFADFLGGAAASVVFDALVLLPNKKKCSSTEEVGVTMEQETAVGERTALLV